MKSSIWFIILAYNSNRSELLRIRSSLKGHNIVVVDNSDEEGKQFRNPMDDIAKKTVVLTQNHNTGYARGMNTGIEYAYTRGAEWIVLLNDDISITKSSVDIFVQALSKKEPSIVGAFVGRLDPKRWTTILLPHAYQKHTEKHFDYVSGSCLAIHRNVIEAVGLLYEPYFMYYEDADYSLRAKKEGFPLFHIPVLGISHASVKSDTKNSAMEYYLARNHLLFVKRQAPSRVQWYERVRLPKTLWEHTMKKENQAQKGVRDYLSNTFGKGEIS